MMVSGHEGEREPAATMLDRLWRLAYRVGFRAARLWWRLRRPDHDGAVVAIWLDGGRILAVQQSCRANPSWPGGGIRRGEEPREAARRELQEELGLDVRPDDLVLAREMAVDWDFRRERVRVFEFRLRGEPVLRIDNREIVGARFVEPRALLAEEGLPPFIRAHLGGARPASWGHGRRARGAAVRDRSRGAPRTHPKNGAGQDAAGALPCSGGRRGRARWMATNSSGGWRGCGPQGGRKRRPRPCGGTTRK